jgi:hypothetical protein
VPCLVRLIVPPSPRPRLVESCSTQPRTDCERRERVGNHALHIMVCPRLQTWSLLNLDWTRLGKRFVASREFEVPLSSLVSNPAQRATRCERTPHCAFSAVQAVLATMLTSLMRRSSTWVQKESILAQCTPRTAAYRAVRPGGLHLDYSSGLPDAAAASWWI